MLVGAARQEVALAREIRARELVAGTSPAAVAAAILAECGPAYGTSRIRARRLALGIALADVVAQVRAWYQAEGRRVPRFSETLLSAYESGQKRPGPEYLHYVCAAYRADPPDLGYEGPCLCGRSHRPAGPAPAARLQVSARAPAARGARVPAPAVAVRPGAGPGQDRAGSQPAAASGAAVPEGAVLDPAVRGPAVRGPAGLAPGRPPELLVPEQAPPADAAGDRAGRGLVPAELAAGEDDLRRMLIRLMADSGARLDCEFLGAVDRMRRQMDDALLSGTVSATMIDQWEETTAGYGRRYMTVPSLRLLCDALLDFGDVRRMCAERQPLEFAERLCRVAGQLAGLAGIVMLDLGDQRLARSFFRTARTATDETGDRRLRAWVAVREALVPLYYGDPREAASLASSAIDLAGRRTCVAGVMGPVVEARAQARLARLARRSGRGLRDALDRARGALDRAHDGLADLTAEEVGDTALGYTERQFCFHAGDTLAMLGDHQEAQRSYARALRLYPAAEVLDATLVVFGQARCLADADEPEQALRLGRDRLGALPAEQRTEIVLQAARDLGQSVSRRHPDLPASAEYQEALAAASVLAGPSPASGPARPTMTLPDQQ
ncbi:MAG TPA: XRE family transcriptional regulator [Streptosporangiaceae bacterium]